MKEYEIWLGEYNLGQGYDTTTEPDMIGKVTASSFKIACLLYELRTKLQYIENAESKGEWVDPQSCHWFYNFYTNSNSWSGPYYESREDALKSFKHS